MLLYRIPCAGALKQIAETADQAHFTRLSIIHSSLVHAHCTDNVLNRFDNRTIRVQCTYTTKSLGIRPIMVALGVTMFNVPKYRLCVQM